MTSCCHTTSPYPQIRIQENLKLCSQKQKALFPQSKQLIALSASGYTKASRRLHINQI